MSTAVTRRSGSPYYLLLQIALILTQLLERGSLLKRLAEETGKKVWELFGSLKNLVRRLLESVRHDEWEEGWFGEEEVGRVRISFDTS